MSSRNYLLIIAFECTFIVTHGHGYNHADCAADFLLSCGIHKAIITNLAYGHKKGHCIDAYARAVVRIVRYN